MATGEIGVRGRLGDLSESVGRGPLVLAMFKESFGLTVRAAYILAVGLYWMEK